MPFEARDGQAHYYMTGLDTPMCPYECKEGYTSFEQNHKCLNNVQLFFDNMGGISIFIIIIIATVFAVGAIIYFLYADNKQNNLEDDQNLNKLKL